MAIFWGHKFIIYFLRFGSLVHSCKERFFFCLIRSISYEYTENQHSEWQEIVSQRDIHTFEKTRAELVHSKNFSSCHFFIPLLLLLTLYISLSASDLACLYTNSVRLLGCAVKFTSPVLPLFDVRLLQAHQTIKTET